MRPVTRRSGDDGASMVIVAIVLLSLLAVSALAVDTGALVVERRSLQNSADAAALAVAQDCIQADCGDARATAATYADRNANDGATAVDEVCGTAPLAACPDPPDVPAGASYVRVTTSTRTADGSTQVPFTFAKVMGFTGQTVHARATVAWGGPTGLTSDLPLTIGACEWSQYTSEGTTFPGPPPYGNDWPAERVIVFHNPNAPTTGCPKDPAGKYMPGGFGWLAADRDCRAVTRLEEQAINGSSTGNSPPNTCDPDDFEERVGTVVHLPVFESYQGVGSNATYTIKGYAAYYLTGYSIVGQYKRKSLVTGSFPCSGGNVTCISGFFLDDQLVSAPGTIGGGSLGSVLVQLVE